MNHVLIIVPLVLDLNPIVLLVLKVDIIQMSVTVHTDYMMMVLKIQNVKLVTKDVLDVMLKTIIVPFVLNTDLVSQNVNVLMV